MGDRFPKRSVRCQVPKLLATTSNATTRRPNKARGTFPRPIIVIRSSIDTNSAPTLRSDIDHSPSFSREKSIKDRTHPLTTRQRFNRKTFFPSCVCPRSLRSTLPQGRSTSCCCSRKTPSVVPPPPPLPERNQLLAPFLLLQSSLLLPSTPPPFPRPSARAG